MSDGVEHPGDDEGFRPPLPPDDRLWRHPSELRGSPAEVSAPEAPPRSRSAFGLLGLLVVGSVAVAATVLLVGQTLELDRGGADTAARFAASTSTPPAGVEDTAELLGLDGIDTDEGVMITDCAADGAAGSAGLRAGDLLVSLGGVAILRMDDVTRVVTRRREGALPVEVRRGAQLMAAELQLEPAE